MIRSPRPVPRPRSSARPRPPRRLAEASLSPNTRRALRWGPPPPRRLARRTSARGCNPRRLPRRAPRPGEPRRRAPLRRWPRPASEPASPASRVRLEKAPPESSRATGAPSLPVRAVVDRLTRPRRAVGSIGGTHGSKHAADTGGRAVRPRESQLRKRVVAQRNAASGRSSPCCRRNGTAWVGADGSGQTSAGLEVVGGLRVARGVFRVEAWAGCWGCTRRKVTASTAPRLTLSVGDGARRPGLTLSVSPRWGAPATASDALWRDHLFHRRTPGAPGGETDERALAARVDYGLQLAACGKSR